MSKIIICHGQENDGYYGIGKDIKESFVNYKKEAGGDDSVDECKFYESEEIEVEFSIKRKETAVSAAKK